MQNKLQLKNLFSPILQVTTLLSIRNKHNFEYFCTHTFCDFHDHGKERIVTKDRVHYNSLTLHSMEGGEAHRSG